MLNMLKLLTWSKKTQSIGDISFTNFSTYQLTCHCYGNIIGTLLPDRTFYLDTIVMLLPSQNLIIF